MHHHHRLLRLKHLLSLLHHLRYHLYHLKTLYLNLRHRLQHNRLHHHLYQQSLLLYQ
jgi:hypothetical protein